VDEEFRGYAMLYSDLDRLLVHDIGGTWYTDPAHTEKATNGAQPFHDNGYRVYYISRPFMDERFTQVRQKKSVFLTEFTNVTTS